MEEEVDEKKKVNTQVADLQKELQIQTETIETLKQEATASRKELDKRKKANEYLEAELVKLRKELDEQARTGSGIEAERQQVRPRHSTIAELRLTISRRLRKRPRTLHSFNEQNGQSIGLTKR